MFTAEGNTNAKREHNTWAVGETYQVQMSGSCTKKTSKCRGGGGGGGLDNDKIRKTSLPICCFNFYVVSTYVEMLIFRV